MNYCGKLLVVFVTIISVGVSGCGRQEQPQTVDAVPRRIVSMSPGLTETLFALGVGDRVVGVSRFCNYPAEVTSRPRVGGFLDPNWEAVVALKPDLVVVMESQAAVQEHMTRLAIPTLRIDQHDVDSALLSFEVLGQACGTPERGRELRRSVGAQLEEVRRAVAMRKRPEVLVVVGRAAGSGRINSVWAAAQGTFFDDVLTLAGGHNVLENRKMGAHPEISREGMLKLDPEVVLDVIPDLDERGLSREAAMADWANMNGLRSVKNRRVVVLGGSYMSTPGPRMALVVEAVAEALHGGLKW